MAKVVTVFIIVLNYNGKRTLSRCLRSIQALEYARKEVVIVDNASTDGSFDIAFDQMPTAHFIRNSENVGFARGVNVGIRYAVDRGADFVWLLNSDAFASKDSLGRLISLLRKHDSVGMVSPVIYEPRKAYQRRRRVWFAGGRINWLRFRAEHTRIRSRSHPFETGFLSGCALLIRVSALKKVGLFDERFFLYYEDVDLSLRMKKMGYKTVVSPHASLVHSEESSQNPDKIYWLVRSGLFFFQKSLPATLQPFFWLSFFVRQSINSFRRRIQPDDQTLTLVERAFRDFRTYGY